MINMEFTQEEKNWLIALLSDLTFKMDAISQHSTAYSILNKLNILTVENDESATEITSPEVTETSLD